MEEIDSFESMGNFTTEALAYHRGKADFSVS